jgi:branched-chain amino acid transport system permease protein
MQYLVSGLATGSIYALVALGLALIYRSTRILNFAHGDITTAGTFFAFMLIFYLLLLISGEDHTTAYQKYPPQK